MNWSFLKLARLAGIEPTTPWFVAKYSIQLSYSRERFNYTLFFDFENSFFSLSTQKKKIFCMLIERTAGKMTSIGKRFRRSGLCEHYYMDGIVGALFS